ncbi:LURP-one-related/scramblase family protein [Clostridium lacusfryxellense]|uniref:LURP-one-related/scramblase family protein n=1 Tax=Clostridium lacusfryxellense TaxID=205328 RepID=UPI001C0BC39B|nr:LURP-one-related family protein [Clostridium lacusfryxellense]MBU3111341.1 LURP-one-related family protein [Clostridium lacusfryxellense]
MNFYIRQKVFSIGDKFSITDVSGNNMFNVEGKVFSLGKKLRIYDMSNNEIVYIEQKLFKLLPEYSIFFNGNYAAKVKKEFTFFSNKFNIDSNMGNYEIEGDFFAHDFSIIKNGSSIAEINKKWLSWGDTYEITINEGENYAFILALVIVVDQVLHDNKNKNNG